MEEENDFTEIIPPWTRYRLLLLKIAKHLDLDKYDRDYFKVFFYESITTSSWNDSVVDQLMKMEQARVICIDNLEGLTTFFKDIGESSEILAAIRKFQMRMRTFHFLMADLPQDEWLYSPPIRRFIFKIPKELEALFLLWRNHIRGTSSLTWFDVKDIYSLATQRISKTAEVARHSRDHLLSFEVIAIADFLLEELSEWFLRQTDLDLKKGFNIVFKKSLRKF